MNPSQDAAEPIIESVPIWKIVKNLEEGVRKQESQLGEITATMWVNFGPEGKVIPNLVDISKPAIGQVIQAFTYYVNRLKSVETVLGKLIDELQKKPVSIPISIILDEAIGLLI